MVEYRNAELALPAPSSLEEYLGIVTWFVDDGMRNASRYRSWLQSCLEKGIKVVMLGNFGAWKEAGRSFTAWDRAETGAIFRLLGAETDFLFLRLNRVSILHKETRYFDFETDLQIVPPVYFPAVRSARPENRVLLRLLGANRTLEPVVLSRRGGFAFGDILVRQLEDEQHFQWMLNPYRFFTEALGISGLPRLDLNTAGGFRIAFVHIDGDGFSTISKIDRWHLCAELARNRIFKRFLLPYSVSVIAAEIDSQLIGNGRTLETARSIFRLPNVEAASHGFAHPFDWRRGILELDTLKHYRFDPETEIGTSVRFIQEQLLPPWKTIRLFFWTGMCNPTPAHLELAARKGLLAINGIAGKLYEKAPSLTNFAPPYSQIGNRIRINSRISNEYEFTFRWRGNLGGFRDVIKSLEFTNRPPNQIPANIYFHFYSLQYEPSWDALRDVFRWAQTQPWTFIYTSQYIEMVHDFLSASISRTDAQVWNIRTAGQIRTLRIPASMGVPDLVKSRHILGYRRSGQELLIHLDSHREHRLHLLKEAKGQSPRPYLVEARAWVDSMKVEKGAIRVWAFGYGRSLISLADIPAGSTYRITVRGYPHIGPDRRGRAFALATKLPFKQEVVYARAKSSGTLTIRPFLRNYTVIQIDPVGQLAYFYGKVRLFLFLGIALSFVILIQRRIRFQND